MNLEEARTNYREKRRETNAGSGAELAYNCTKIGTCDILSQVEDRMWRLPKFGGPGPGKDFLS